MSLSARAKDPTTPSISAGRNQYSLVVPVLSQIVPIEIIRTEIIRGNTFKRVKSLSISRLHPYNGCRLVRTRRSYSSSWPNGGLASITLAKVVLNWDHCIIRHSLRYFRHSGSVIYTSKLPSPSVSMPCDYPILQSPTKGQILLVLLETVGRSQISLLRLSEGLALSYSI